MKRISLVFLSLGLMWACGRQQAGVTGSHSTIMGKISGFGGRAPALARVDVYEPGRSDTPRRIPAAADGSYAATTSQTGVVRLSFTGVQHSPYTISLLLEKPMQLKVDIRLAPYEWTGEFKEILVIGDFNRWSRDSGFVLMVRQRDGTYAAELGNLSSGKMGYRLIGLVKNSTRSVPGTQYDDLDTDPAGNFVSRLTVRNGQVRIIFDPASLPRSVVRPGFTFADSGSEVARVAGLDLEMRTRQEEYFRALSEFTSYGKNSRDFRYDWANTAADLLRRLESEQMPAVRQMLLLNLLDLRHMGAQEIDAEIARSALAAIPADSALWELAPGYLLYESIKLAGGLGHYENYFKTVVDRHPSREVRALALEQAYRDAGSSLDLDRAREYYRRLTTDFGDLLPGQRVKSRPPELGIAPGKK